jgi:hypothetical protein
MFRLYGNNTKKMLVLGTKKLLGDADAINMMALHGSDDPDDTWNLPRGCDYDWSKPHFPRKANLWKNAETFLENAIEEANEDNFKVEVPMRKIYEQVLYYDINDATASQAAVLYKFFNKIQAWISWEASTKKVTFVPLRLTFKGAAGTGKSFIIITIVSYFRRMFGDNDVVHVVAPTGMDAFNVLGETLHRFAGLDWQNMTKYMKKGLKNSCRKNYKTQ